MLNMNNYLGHKKLLVRVTMIIKVRFPRLRCCHLRQTQRSHDHKAIGSHLKRQANEEKGSIQCRIDPLAPFVCQAADNCNNSFCEIKIALGLRYQIFANSKR